MRGPTDTSGETPGPAGAASGATPPRWSAGKRVWLTWLGLWGAPSLVLLGQKGLRVGLLSPAPGSLSAAWLMVPDVLFLGGVAALTWSWLSRAERRPGERGLRAGLAGWQVQLGLLLLVSTACHRYFVTTGTPLDFPMFALGLVEIGDRAQMRQGF